MFRGVTSGLDASAWYHERLPSQIPRRGGEDGPDPGRWNQEQAEVMVDDRGDPGFCKASSLPGLTFASTSVSMGGRATLRNNNGSAAQSRRASLDVPTPGTKSIIYMKSPAGRLDGGLMGASKVN